MKLTRRLSTLLALTLPLAHAQFKFDPLPTLSGGGPTPVVFANGVNSAGDVCGGSSYLDNTHAFLFKPYVPNATSGAMLDLGAVPHPGGTNWSVCTAVSTYAPVGYGFYPTVTGTPTPTTPSSSHDFAHTYRALVYAGEAFKGAAPVAPYILPIPTSFTSPTFAPNSYALAINAGGKIVGTWTPDSFVTHAIEWLPNSLKTAYTAIDMNILGYTGWLLEVATGVNDLGQVVGHGTFKGSEHGFLITPGTGITDLGTMMPLGINNKSEVVGYAFITMGASSGFHHAMYWSAATGTIDLGAPTLPLGPGMPPPPPLSPIPPIGPMPPTVPVVTFTNTVAAAINDNGKIVGWGNMFPFGSILYTETIKGWGAALAYDMNTAATPPELAYGWNLLSAPTVTSFPPLMAPTVPIGLPGTAPPPISPFLAATAINDFDQIAGVFLKPGPLYSGFLLTAPLKP